MMHTFRLIILLLICTKISYAQSAKVKTIPRDTSYTPYSAWMAIRSDYPEAKIVKPHLPDGVLADTNVVYATLPHTPYGKRALHLDLFRPKSSKKYPAIILIHGGGWVTGNKSMQVPLAQQIANKGYVTASVEYRLAPEAHYPAAIYDIKAAIRFLRANAEKYNIDPDQIAILGCSAGGQLAALVGMTNGIEKFEGDEGSNTFSSIVQTVIDIDGVVDFLAPGSLNVKRKPDTYDIMWFGGTFYEKPNLWKDASPIFWVNENSVPFLFLNSGFSRFHAGQDEMLAMMKQWGIYTEVHAFDVKIHPFWLFSPWFEKTVAYSISFLDKMLK